VLETEHDPEQNPKKMSSVFSQVANKLQIDACLVTIQQLLLQLERSKMNRLLSVPVGKLSHLPLTSILRGLGYHPPCEGTWSKEEEVLVLNLDLDGPLEGVALHCKGPRGGAGIVNVTLRCIALLYFALLWIRVGLDETR